MSPMTIIGRDRAEVAVTTMIHAKIDMSTEGQAVETVGMVAMIVSWITENVSNVVKRAIYLKTARTKRTTRNSVNVTSVVNMDI